MFQDWHLFIIILHKYFTFCKSYPYVRHVDVKIFVAQIKLCHHVSFVRSFMYSDLRGFKENDVVSYWVSYW